MYVLHRPSHDKFLTPGKKRKKRTTENMDAKFHWLTWDKFVCSVMGYLSVFPISTCFGEDSLPYSQPGWLVAGKESLTRGWISTSSVVSAIFPSWVELTIRQVWIAAIFFFQRTMINPFPKWASPASLPANPLQDHKLSPSIPWEPTLQRSNPGFVLSFFPIMLPPTVFSRV